jgi:phage FluMu protein Com
MDKLIPEIEVFARPFGYLQWVCPNCHEIFGAKQISGRTARIVCNHCARVYRLGLSFGRGNNLPAPWNAKLAGQWNGYTANRLGDPFPPNAIARFRGRLDWRCPQCETTQSSAVGRELMDVRCGACSKIFYLSVLFYNSKPGAIVTCPIDWSPPFEPTESPSNPLAAEAASQS